MSQNNSLQEEKVHFFFERRICYKSPSKPHIHSSKNRLQSHLKKVYFFFRTGSASNLQAWRPKSQILTKNASRTSRGQRRKKAPLQLFQLCHQPIYLFLLRLQILLLPIYFLLLPANSRFCRWSSCFCCSMSSSSSPRGRTALSTFAPAHMFDILVLVGGLSLQCASGPIKSNYYIQHRGVVTLSDLAPHASL